MWLSLMGGGELPRIKIPNIDKLVHITLYMVLAFLLYFGWSKQTVYASLHQSILLKIFFVAFLYGLMIEVLQEALTTTRHFELLDLTANSFGAILGCIIGVKLFK